MVQLVVDILIADHLEQDLRKVMHREEVLVQYALLLLIARLSAFIRHVLLIQVSEEG